MALFKKKKDDELPPIPEPEEFADLPPLPPLPPLPGEEEFEASEPIQRAPKMRVPDFQMPEEPPRQEFTMPQMPQQFVPQVAQGATVFVRIDKYKDVMTTVASMQDKLEELKSTLNAIAAIKGKEAEIIDGWHAMLQHTKTKIDEINTKLSKPLE